MVPDFSPCEPTRNPGLSTKCITGKWKVSAISRILIIFWEASAVHPPPYTWGSLASITIGQPFNLAKPDTDEVPQFFPISKKLPLSVTLSIIGLICHEFS